MATFSLVPLTALQASSCLLKSSQGSCECQDSMSSLIGQTPVQVDDQWHSQYFHLGGKRV